LLDLLLAHWARDTLNGPNPYGTPDWSLSTGMSHKWPMTFGNTSTAGVIDFEDRIFAAGELA
jgi:hypothetical protein